MRVTPTKKLAKRAKLNIFMFVEIAIAFASMAFAFSYLDLIRSGAADFITEEIIYLSIIFAFTALLVTALGIIGMQLIMVLRRRSEIGLHRAVGATGLDIMRLILKDTLLLILSPALVGVGVGIWISLLFSIVETGLETHIDFVFILEITLSLLLFTFLCGLVPAIKAVRMDPAVVLSKHVAVVKKPVSKRPLRKIATIAFYSMIALIFVACIFVNHSLEAAYQDDVVNSSGPPPATTQRAPAFSFVDGEGKVISSDSLQYKSYCLLIGAVDCPGNSIMLNELSKHVAAGLLESTDIYAIHIDSPIGTSIDAIEKYLRENNFSVAAYIDYEKSTEWAFNVSSLPALYIINEDGIITARFLGWSEYEMEYLRDSLLKRNTD